MIAAGGTPSFASPDPGFGYTSPINPPSTPGELNHAQILHNIYNQNFTLDGANGRDYVGSGGITAKRVYDFDAELAQITHVYNHEPNDIDQIWTDGAVTVTAEAKYATFHQAFGWNGDNGLGTVFHKLVDDTNIGQPGVTFTITAGQEFLWGYQARDNPRCPWWQPPYENLEWWSRPESHHHCVGEDHMITYFMEGASSTKSVWTIFMEDVRFTDGSDKDYNDFVVEIRAIPEPATICLLALGGGLALLRKRRA